MGLEFSMGTIVLALLSFKQMESFTNVHVIDMSESRILNSDQIP